MYKRQHLVHAALGTVLPMRLAGIVEAFAAGAAARMPRHRRAAIRAEEEPRQRQRPLGACLLYTSTATARTAIP